MMMAWLWLVAVLCLIVVAHGATSCSRPALPDDEGCSSMVMLLGSSSSVHQSVLRQLCQRGRHHIRRPHLGPHTTHTQHDKTVHQFAVMNLHRDSFSDVVSWTSGEAEDVVCKADWYMNDEVQLSNGYKWYRHGLPMWPLLNQTLSHKPRQLIRKKLDWPNYAFATPLGLIPHENRNFRDPAIAVQKLFLGDIDSRLTDKIPLDKFIKPDKFQTFVNQFITAHGNDINVDADDYKNWLLPLIQQSFPSMIESFKARQKSRGPKSSQLSKCPDVLYIFFQQQPCPDMSSCLLLNEIQLSLRTSTCGTTNLVVGHASSLIAVQSKSLMQGTANISNQSYSQSVNSGTIFLALSFLLTYELCFKRNVPRHLGVN